MLVRFFAKANDEYKQIFRVPRIDWCDVMSSQKSSNYLVRTIVDGFKESHPQLIHECPYQGIHTITSINLNKNFGKMLPAGDIRTEYKVVDGKFFMIIETLTTRIIK